MIKITIPWWVWLTLIVVCVGCLVYAVMTDPDPQPSLFNIVRYVTTIWARDVHDPLRGQRSQRHPRGDGDTEAPQTRQTGDQRGFESRGERECRRYMEQRFGCVFQKTRPSFLKNPVTGENLELDMYNEDLRLGVEYNGRQHYRFSSHFHQNSNDRFQNQQYRDLIKKQLCQEHGVTLIIVPYWVKIHEIPEFLEKELEKHNR